MVLTGLKLGVNKLISMYGRELTRRMYAASLETIDAVERIVKEEDIACDFERTGHLEVACKQAHFDDYARQVDVIAREFSHQLRVVPREQLRDEIGSDIYYGGMVDEISAGLNPARYVAGLALGAMRAGARICERTRLQNIQRESRAGGRASGSTVLGARFGRATCWWGRVDIRARRLPRCEKKLFPSGHSSLPLKFFLRRWPAS